MTKKTTKDNMNCVLYQKSQLKCLIPVTIKVLFSTSIFYFYCGYIKRFLHPLYDTSGYV